MALHAGKVTQVWWGKIVKSASTQKTLYFGPHLRSPRGLCTGTLHTFRQTNRSATPDNAIACTRRCRQNNITLVTGARRLFTTSPVLSVIKDTGQDKYKVLVIGGGAGGSGVAAKYARKFGPGHVGVIEPSDTHYYQPMWTLVGAGIKEVGDSARPMESTLPKNATWVRDSVQSFDPKNNSVTTTGGKKISYDYLVVAMGIQLNYDQIKGLPEAFDVDDRLCSNYWRKTVEKTFPALKSFKRGNAIFTFPNTPIKCAGAPQKIMYLAEHFFRNEGKREQANVIFNSSLGVIFGVKKYAESLLKVVKDRNIQVNYKRNLIEVRPETSEAVFANLDSESAETETFKYDFLHITPPMSSPDVLRNSSLVDASGYLNVNKNTLQHVEFPNIFGIGDCTNVPTSKTAAAAAAQTGILKKNLDAVIEGKSPHKEYDGYTSCPLITGYGSCILAEFDFNAEPLETFPIDQSIERRTMYHLKKDVMPTIYWSMFAKGLWEGPAMSRRLLHLGLKK